VCGYAGSLSYEVCDDEGYWFDREVWRSVDARAATVAPDNHDIGSETLEATWFMDSQQRTQYDISLSTASVANLLDRHFVSSETVMSTPLKTVPSSSLVSHIINLQSSNPKGITVVIPVVID
jgi:hypothetical protein